MIQSFQNHPEKWKEYQDSNKKLLKNFYRHDAGMLIYCAESNLSTSSYELRSTHFIVKGVEIISPYKEKFSSYNQNIIRDELYKMISKRNAASLEEQEVTYSDLESMIEELIPNCSAYCLTSPNDTLRKWAERVVKK